MKEELIIQLKDLHAQGMNNKAISNVMNCTQNTVGRRLKALGLKTNKPSFKLDVLDAYDARCSKCKQIKPLLEFETVHLGTPYETSISYCNSCRLKQRKIQLEQPLRNLSNRYYSVKSRCNRELITFTLTKEHFMDIYRLQDGKCFYTDVDLSLNSSVSDMQNAMSVDRVLPELGYINHNIVMCSRRVNAIKHDQTLEEMQEWMPKWYQRITECDWLNIDNESKS